MEKAWDRGFKTATLKFYPDIVAYELLLPELEKKIEGKNAVIIDHKETIEKQNIIISTNEQKIINRNIGLAVGIPAGVIVGIVTGLIIGNSMK